MQSRFLRPWRMPMLLCWALLLAIVSTSTPAADTPRLGRILIATVATAQLDATAELYQRWLDYTPVERGTVAAAKARSWGAPAMAGRPYALLRGASGDDVYLRVVEITPPESYEAMNSYGWNAIEMIVEDPDAVHEQLAGSPFQHIGGPAFLDGGTSSIRAVQFKGPSEEVFYFTTDTGERENSMLLEPRARIDRPFIMVLAGADARAIMDFYRRHFALAEAFFIQTPVNVVSAAQGLPGSHLYPLGFLRLARFSNGIEVDGYPPGTGPRKASPGELPPGVSMASFSVHDLDQLLGVDFLAPPQRFDGLAYAGARAATVRGPAGELIELIETFEPDPAPASEASAARAPGEGAAPLWLAGATRVSSDPDAQLDTEEPQP